MGGVLHDRVERRFERRFGRRFGRRLGRHLGLLKLLFSHFRKVELWLF